MLRGEGGRGEGGCYLGPFPPLLVSCISKLSYIVCFRLTTHKVQDSWRVWTEVVDHPPCDTLFHLNSILGLSRNDQFKTFLVEKLFQT